MPQLKPFPKNLLKPRHAIMSGESGDISIEILLAPFVLDNDTYNESSIQLDGINLKKVQLRDLVGKHFTFPVNPDDGYIDGSIYLNHRHHPVDVTSLIFNDGSDGITLVVKGIYKFEYEILDWYQDTPFTFGVALSSSIF